MESLTCKFEEACWNEMYKSNGNSDSNSISGNDREGLKEEKVTFYLREHTPGTDPS